MYLQRHHRLLHWRPICLYILLFILRTTYIKYNWVGIHICTLNQSGSKTRLVNRSLSPDCFRSRPGHLFGFYGIERRAAGSLDYTTTWSQPGSHSRLFQHCNLWRLAPKAADQLIGETNPEQSYTESSTWNRHWRSRFWSVTGTLVRSVALCNVYPAYRSSAITTIKQLWLCSPCLSKRVSRFFSFKFHTN